MIIPSMAAISHMGHTSAVNIPVTKKRQPSPMGFLFLYMGKPPVNIVRKGRLFCYKAAFVLTMQKNMVKFIYVRFMVHLIGYYYLRDRK